MPRFKDQAICVRHIDWSESSQIVALLTQEHGKVRGLAKGSKRMSPGIVARFSGGVELLTGGQVVATTRPTTDLATITEWDLQQPNYHLHENLSAQRLALYAADIVNAILADHDPHTEVFTAMHVFLERLAEPDHHPSTLLRFHWSILQNCGYRPQLDEDVVAGGPLERSNVYRFDPHRGGFTGAGADASSSAWGVRHQTVEVLRRTAEGKVDGSTEVIDRANRLLCVYLRAILDRQLPTMAHVLNSNRGL